jgi:hypothetical protein
VKQSVVIYTRVSTDKQTTDSQLASLREYAMRQGWQDVQVITDTISGAKTSRKGLDTLMKAVRVGKIDVVLCYNLDRLGRSLSHLAQLLGEFAAQKVALIVPGQGINTSSIGMSVTALISRPSVLELRICQSANSTEVSGTAGRSSRLNLRTARLIGFSDSINSSYDNAQHARRSWLDRSATRAQLAGERNTRWAALWLGVSFPFVELLIWCGRR